MHSTLLREAVCWIVCLGGCAAYDKFLSRATFSPALSERLNEKPEHVTEQERSDCTPEIKMYESNFRPDSLACSRCAPGSATRCSCSRGYLYS